MKVISGLFDTHEEARKAVAALEDAGIPSTEISVVSPRGDGGASETAAGAGIGAAIGGVGGLLAGLGAFAIPGIGPFVGAGWLVATLAGAAAGGIAGGLIGSLTEAGLDERDAHVYAEAIKRGGTMVMVRAEDAMEDAAAAILGRHGQVDIAARRAEYEAEGWEQFNEIPVADADGRPRVPDPIIKAGLPR